MLKLLTLMDGGPLGVSIACVWEDERGLHSSLLDSLGTIDDMLTRGITWGDVIEGKLVDDAQA